jgi:hypothetical protein
MIMQPFNPTLTQGVSATLNFAPWSQPQGDWRSCGHSNHLVKLQSLTIQIWEILI